MHQQREVEDEMPSVIETAPSKAPLYTLILQSATVLQDWSVL